MKTFSTDNRWGTGSLEEHVPDNAVAVYGARWIDHNDWFDIVHDRQGFAYNNRVDRDLLIREMQLADLQARAATVKFDLQTQVVDRGGDAEFTCWMRRSGGYVYVVAWITD